MSLNLQTIRNALADQIRNNLSRQTNVYPGRTPQQFPCVTIRPGAPYVTYFETMGSNGQSDVMLEVRVHVNTSTPDSDEIAMDAYLSIGSANQSSVADAIHVDKTLGGVVHQAFAAAVESVSWTDEGYVAVIPVLIILGKAGANA